MIKPVNDAHSIKAVAFILEFDKDIDKQGLEVVSEAYKRFRKKLLLKRAIRRFNISLNVFDGHAATPESIAGYRFFTKAKDDTEEAWFEITSSRVIYCTTNYIDFNSFLAEALYYAEVSIAAFAPAGASIVKIGIEYRDEFVSPDISWPTESLINLDSPYLSRAAITQGELWHSHCGMMSECDIGKRLDALKVEHIQQTDINDEASFDFRVVVVLTHLADIEPFSVASVDNEKARNYLVKAIASLRVAHKNIFSSIIAQPMLAAVGLDS